MNTQSTSDFETSARLYQTMFKIRRSEEKVAEIYPTDKIQSPVHLCIGQEAVSTGVCHALEPTDHVYGTYRSHGTYIAKGGDLRKLFAELYAKDTGCARGKGGSMHLIAKECGFMGSSAIVASTIPLAVGDALAAKMQRSDRVVVALFGDGGVDEGVFFESLNFASVKELPVILVCENNNYAVHSTVSDRHRQRELYRYGEGLGVAGRRFDGNDVSVVYKSMKEAVREVRKNPKPLLLEYTTYRWYEHVGPGRDHQESYRDKEKLAWALAHDPLEIAKADMKSRSGVSGDTFARWEESIMREVEDAVSFAEASSFPEVSRLYEDLFEEKR